MEKAKLTLVLKAESGYESEEEHTITLDQWGAIQKILFAPPPYNPEKPFGT